ncbi:MAG: hypothetical protein ACFB2X_20855 [Rivularia sp. (in: cyanobacteria)]
MNPKLNFFHNKLIGITQAVGFPKLSQSLACILETPLQLRLPGITPVSNGVASTVTLTQGESIKWNWVPTNQNSGFALSQGYGLRTILRYQGRRYLIQLHDRPVVFVPSFKKAYR